MAVSFALVSTLLAGCDPAGAPPSDLAGPPTSGGTILLLSQQQLEALDAMTPEVEAALSSLSEADDAKRTAGLRYLESTSPLPTGARVRIRDLLGTGNSWIERYASSLLATHHVGAAEDAAAFERLAEKETNATLKAIYAGFAEYVRQPTPPVAVIADSKAVDGAVDDALLAALQKPGRKIRSSVMSERGPEGAKVSGIVGPTTEDLPEVVSLDGGQLAIGWEWRADFSDDAASVTGQSGSSTEISYTRANTKVRPAPVGAMLRVLKPAKVGNTTLAAGTVLVRCDHGWSLIDQASARAFASAGTPPSTPAYLLSPLPDREMNKEISRKALDL